MNWLAHPQAPEGLLQAALWGVQHFRSALGLLLLLASLRCLYALARFVYVYLLRRGVDPLSYGAWAVVTGATDGIGKAYAALLAQRGLNIVLVSRSDPRLRECAAELERLYGVQTRTVAADLCKLGAAALDAIAAAVQGMEVGILVNNAGLGPAGGVPDYLEELPDQFIYDILSINALAPAALCTVVLPGMRERGRGLVINVGSVIANFDAPLVAAYGATKAFLNSLSRSLDAEYAPLGVRVQNQWAGSVATKMPGIKTASLSVPSPTTWAAAALRQMGHEPSATPYWVHALLSAMMEAAPTAILNRQVLRAMTAKRRGAKVAIATK